MSQSTEELELFFSLKIDFDLVSSSLALSVMSDLRFLI